MIGSLIGAGAFLVLVVLWALIAGLPGVAELFSKLFWNSLGKIPIFELSVQIFDSFLHHETVPEGAFLQGLAAVLFNSMADALVIGCCIFLVKSVCTKFNRVWKGRLTHSDWLLTFFGVVLGVVACSVAEAFGGARGLLVGIVSLACMIGGLLLLCRSLNFSWGGTYSQRWSGYVGGLMLDILGDVLEAVCAVFIVTALLEGPRFLKMGGSIWVCIGWVLSCGLVIFLRELFLNWLKPNPA